MHYISWQGSKISYRYDDTSQTEYRQIPTSYVPFKIVIYKDHFEFWESGELIKNASTREFGDATHFQLLIGGWDDSPLKSHMYFDEVKVSYEFTPTETEIQSPIETSSPENTSSTASTSSGKTCGPGVMALLVILAAIRRR